MKTSKTEIKDFTKGNITKQLVVFAWPLFLSNLLQVAYNMVDMVIVGNELGKVGLSSVSVGGDVSNLLTFIVMGFANAGQVIIAKLIGSKQNEKIGRFVGTMSSFLFGCAIVLSIVGLLCRSVMLGLMNTPLDSYQGALEYSTVCMSGLIFIYGYNIVSAVLRGMGDSKHPFIFVAMAAIINLVLDILFVMLLDMGPKGAALATVISQATSFITCTLFLLRNRQRFELKMSVKDFVQWDKEMLGDLVKLGIPMAIKTASIQVSKLFVNSWINSYGIAVSAFAGIANKVSSICNLISSAINTAGSTMVGQNIAAKEYGRVKGILKSIAVIILTIMGIIAIIVYMYPMKLFGFFTSDPDVLDIAVNYVPIAMLVFLGSALRAIMNALINGSGNYKINFATAIMDGIVLRIGFSMLFGLVLGMKHYGFWLGDAVAGFTPFVIGLIFYFSGSWKNAAEKKTA